MATTQEQRARNAAAQRRWAAKNRDRLLEKSRARDPEHVRSLYQDWVAKNPERRKESSQRAKRNAYARGYKNAEIRRRNETTAKLWVSQDGLCYLCEEPVSLDVAVLEHDHRCCPGQSRNACRHCIRGVAHNRCNSLIGFAGDDPDLLIKVAANLKAKLVEMEPRIAAKPQQLMMVVND